MSNQDEYGYKIISNTEEQDLPDKFILDNTEYAKSDIFLLVLNNNFKKDVNLYPSIIDWKDKLYIIIQLVPDIKISGNITYKKESLNIDIDEIITEGNSYIVFYLDKLSKIDVSFSRIKEPFFQKYKVYIRIIIVLISLGLLILIIVVIIFAILKYILKNTPTKALMQG